MEGLRAALPLLKSGGFGVVVLCTAVHPDPHLPPYDPAPGPPDPAAADAGGGGGEGACSEDLHTAMELLGRCARAQPRLQTVRGRGRGGGVRP